MKIDLSTLTDELRTIWEAYQHKGWQFVFLLRDGLTELREELGVQYEEREVLEQIGNALDMRYKTLVNKLIVARKPWAGLAYELGLDIGHGDAVSGLDDEQAEDLLHRAAEQRWTVAELRREVYMSKHIQEVERLGSFPVNGIAGTLVIDGEVFPFAPEGDEPPYCNDAFYEDPPAGVRVHDYSRPELEEQRQKVKSRLPPVLWKELVKLETMIRQDERERVA